MQVREGIQTFSADKRWTSGASKVKRAEFQKIHHLLLGSWLGHAWGDRANDSPSCKSPKPTSFHGTWLTTFLSLYCWEGRQGETGRGEAGEGDKDRAPEKKGEGSAATRRPAASAWGRQGRGAWLAGHVPPLGRGCTPDPAALGTLPGRDGVLLPVADTQRQE